MARKRTPRLPSGEAIARRSRELLDEKLARDMVILDLRGLSTITDYFVICTGDSQRQIRAVAEHVMETFHKDGVRVNHVEGLDEGSWVVIDYVVAIVHIFAPETRDLYNLESLWGDAPRLD
ncbi:MAG: ribosome silencing factor [Verrucomicrobia bacterium]|nr:ribosome silencing factor [Verrucomicrobiota bacterium]